MGDAQTQVRSCDLPEGYRLSALEDEVATDVDDRAMSVPNRYKATASSSHVLLAAASEHSTARETGGRGVFTQALLSLLRTPGIRTDTITYLDVIKRLPDLPGE
jgi:hypothetical protein